MGFDEIYNTAIWIDSTAREYGTTVSKVTELFKTLNGYHTVAETKNMIEKGFIQKRGEANDPIRTDSARI